MIPLKRLFLRSASPTQINRLAAIDEQWAALTERSFGERAQMVIVATKIRAEAKEFRRLAAVKTAAAEAAVELAK